ncbi:polyphosphate kinase 1 [Thioalkalivibrio sp. XN8]|uniref:polyphosphate kinase 1 n=1 Tax=Thioalkalivibrio sp. XN8 TaxID=2712863 RepID=UPI0013EC1DAC|nr:polyphosphate kinase 1 [Thioalkalivibrio sp. XN8]NGP54753.1 polyphosphate kinase 1 [Thioalkalivibrio sp. XN8]
MSQTATAALDQPAGADLSDPGCYLNRELTWLAFNRRVLREAEDDRTPLLERIKFLAIVSSNLDEFFMKRIGGLKQQLGAGVQERSVDGRTPEQQLRECQAEVMAIKERKDRLFPELVSLLRDAGIRLSRYAELEPADQANLRDWYLENIYPLLTPIGMDPAHPFPFISNLSLNLLVSINRAAGERGPRMVRIKVPVGEGISRFVRVGDSSNYVPLEDVIAHNLDRLLPELEIERWDLFRVTRNAIVERYEEQANDLLQIIEAELRDRKFAPTVRLEVSAEMPPVHRGMLAAELGLDEDMDVFNVDGLMQRRDLMEFLGLDRPELKDPVHHPIEHPKLVDAPNIFHLIRGNGPLLLQHPYESFSTSVERFLREASRDPKVLAIKMTLYRTARKSKIIEYLIDAAENGKQVAVAVELKARFDEEANVRWANSLEEAGIHVSYGVLGLKTHAKVIFVLRRDYDGLRRYAHLGTGNYHSGTARLYSDLGLLTCDPVLGSDLTELFNFLTTGYVANRRYDKLLPAPTHLKRALLAKIEREVELQRNGGEGHIQFKTNALEDADVVRALYRASQAGVKVDLVVRDSCRLRPGVPGLSENVRVISIVGRFLEHTRIYYFRNGGAEEYFIGSADCMKRNLEDRVETVVPVDDPDCQRALREVLDVQLNDRRSAWDMQPDGSYVQRTPGDGDDPRGAQEQLIALAQKRARATGRKKLQGRGKRRARG